MFLLVLLNQCLIYKIHILIAYRRVADQDPDYTFFLKSGSEYERQDKTGYEIDLISTLYNI